MTTPSGSALPLQLRARLADRAFTQILGGESGASVWRCDGDDRPPAFLKVAALAIGLALDDEAARLRWMRDNGLPVPSVLDYARTGDAEFLLLEAVRGVPASDESWDDRRPDVVLALADSLRHLHDTSIADCPFDHRVSRQVDAARIRVARGIVREDDFDEARAGRSAAEVFAELAASVPASEDLVFTHGDFCLPNVILHDDASGGVAVAGFIDCGRAGVADRYQDLALATRSIIYNHGPDLVDMFFRRYGVERVDDAKLEFFTLLDEFF